MVRCGEAAVRILVGMGEKELPRTSRPAESALRAVGVTDLVELAKWTRADLAALHGVGPKAIRILGEALSAAGLAFSGE
ncbi:hypothetical protein EV139_0878 [Leucobacter luti]|uniref:Helix-hairpin-helix protein n=1 Tax=Leucobacter luti TaxID=340320 RepID=A0A4Q7U027_9MICO|nr:hypothetical protein EV139_0878 [Leucobacter luti]